jgi:alanine racemase
VVLLGPQGDDVITAAEIADRLDTIPYEVLCAIGSRIPRTYV